MREHDHNRPLTQEEITAHQQLLCAWFTQKGMVFIPTVEGPIFHF